MNPGSNINYNLVSPVSGSEMGEQKHPNRGKVKQRRDLNPSRLNGYHLFKTKFQDDYDTAFLHLPAVCENTTWTYIMCSKSDSIFCFYLLFFPR